MHILNDNHETNINDILDSNKDDKLLGNDPKYSDENDNDNMPYLSEYANNINDLTKDTDQEDNHDSSVLNSSDNDEQKKIASDNYRFVQQDNPNNEEVESQKKLEMKQTTTFYKLNFINLLFEYTKSLIQNKVNQKQILADYRIKENLNSLNGDSYKKASEIRTLRTKLENKTDDLIKNINTLKLMTVSRLNMDLNQNKYQKEQIFFYEYQTDYTENITISPD